MHKKYGFRECRIQPAYITNKQSFTQEIECLRLKQSQVNKFV